MDAYLTQGTPEWHLWRREGIGASESAAVMGLSPWSTPFKVWEDKTGRAPAFEGNMATQRGNELEGKARALYEMLTMTDMTPACAAHPKYSFMRASFDGVSEDGKKILEIKVPGKETHEAAKAGEIPIYYQTQIQHQLMVSGAESCDFFSYNEKDDSSGMITVLPDLEMQASILRECQFFWNHYVLKDVAPPLMPSDTKVMDGDPKIEELCQRLIELKPQLSKNAEDAIKHLIIYHGGHPRVRCGRVLVTTVERGGEFSFHKLTIAKLK